MNKIRIVLIMKLERNYLYIHTVIQLNNCCPENFIWFDLQLLMNDVLELNKSMNIPKMCFHG